MDPSLTDEQRAIRASARRFAEEEIAPVAAEHDREESYPVAVMAAAAREGLTGTHLPEAYGGAGRSPLAFALIIEELFAVDPGIGLCITSAGFGADVILEFGSTALCERLLPPIAAGDAVMGTAVTEPQAGSDVTAVATRAERDGDEWVIDGEKVWITNGTVGDFYVVLCETDPAVEDRYMGFSTIIVEADRPGLSRERITGKLGVRASDTGALRFDGVRVPSSNLVGTRGMGFLQLMRFFDETRAMVAAQGVGIAAGACERTLSHARDREQTGRPIAERQSARQRLAAMHTRTEAARSLTRRAAWAAATDDPELTALASMAKAFTSEVALRTAASAIQLHGGAGARTDVGVERLYRDAKITQIYEGTTQIQRNVIARELLGSGP